MIRRAANAPNWATVLCAALMACVLAPDAPARLDTKRYGELREAERYQMDVAEKLVQDRKWESAQAEYEKFINLYVKSPGAPYAQFMIAACCENRNLINQAIKEYKAVVSYFPDSPEAPAAAFAIGRCHAKTGEQELAVQQYVQVMTQYPKEPVAGDALWEASEIQLQRDLYEKAFELRRRLVDDAPKSARFNQAVDWLVDHYLFRADDLDAARAVCRQRRNPVETERYLAQRRYDRGHWLYHSQKKTDEGRKFMDKAVEILQGLIEQFPKDKRHVKEAQGMIAQAYRYSGRPDKAFEAYEKLLEANPDDDDWRYQYGLALEENGKWPEARLQYMRFKSKSRGAMQLAESYYRQRNVAEAEAAYMKVVADFPDLAKQALYRVGNLHQYLSGNYEKAINAYRQSEQSPPEYLFRIAECHEAWKKYDLALKDYQEIVGFFKAQAPEAMWRSGLCYERRNQEGDKERAIATFKRVLDLYPGSAQSSQAHQRLESKYKVTYTGGGMKKGQ